MKIKIQKKFKLNRTKKPIEAYFIYDEKIAQSLHQTEYWQAEAHRLRNIKDIDTVRQKLSTKEKLAVSNIISKYKEKGTNEQTRIFNVLQNIRNKICLCINNKQPLPKHDNLLSLIAHPNYSFSSISHYKKKQRYDDPRIPDSKSRI
jgi:hypothetical protein